MLVAFELKMSLKELYQQMDQDELGWWLAFIKRKQVVEEQELERRRNKRNRNRPQMG